MTDEHQKTVAGVAELEGRGLFMGERVKVRIKPAPANHGVELVRTDMSREGAAVSIPALIRHVARRIRRTTLHRGSVAVETCEHCLAALAGLGVDNAVVEVSGPELPAGDGSAQPFVEALNKVGIKTLSQPRQMLRITEAVTVSEGDAMIAALPAEEPWMQVVYELDHGAGSDISKQVFTFDSSNGNFAEHVAPARTFVREEEAKALQDAGLGKHLTADDVLVIGPQGPLGNNRLRFDDELVRHKVVDLIGDLSLVGAPIQGRIMAYRSGHELNHRLARRLEKMLAAQRHGALLHQDGIVDVKSIQRVLPHRFPMLMIDRILEVEGDHRAVGVKNVTINEQFFQGHYPGTPIMPGVLIVEAMAQLSGLLLARKLEHRGKLAVLLSMDHVKLRRPVTPGDQLVLEAETVRVKSRTGHTRCHGYVGGQVAAEAQIKFMLVDAEQEQNP